MAQQRNSPHEPRKKVAASHAQKVADDITRGAA